MRRIFFNILAIIASLSAVSCAEKVNKDVTWPVWASRPILSDMAVVASSGEKAIIAGETVVFSANIKDEYNELTGYTLEVKYADNMVFSIAEDLSGNEAAISKEFVMPFAAYLASGEFYPEVSLSVTNTMNGKSTQRVPKENNVALSRPASPEKLYVIDDRGQSFELLKGDSEYFYETAEGADLSQLGSSFHIAARLSGNAPDYSDLVWGYEDGKIAVLGKDGQAISAPESDGKGFKKLGFDLYSFKIEKLVNHVITFDKTSLASIDQSGVTYLAMERIKLIQDCEIVFKGFGDLKSMLQPDRFEILGENSAKFTGHTAQWSIYYDTADNWLIVNYADFHTPDQIWVTGAKACFPLGNNDTENEFKYLDGDGKSRFATLSAVKDDNGDYRILVYLKDAFVIQLFTRVKWSTQIALNSLTPEYGEITKDGYFINPGKEFVPGVYELVFTVTAKDNNNGDGAAVDVTLTPYQL